MPRAISVFTRSPRRAAKPAADDAEAHRPFLVRAAVVDGEEPVAPAQDPDFERTRLDDPETAILEIADRSNIDGHFVTARTFGTAISVRPLR